MTLNKTDRIVITLGKQIVHGKYVPGSPLPAEAELCEEFATSRNIIREVFRSLMAKRLIEMKRYRGAFVAPRNQWNYLDTDVLQWVLENDYDPRQGKAEETLKQRQRCGGTKAFIYLCFLFRPVGFCFSKILRLCRNPRHKIRLSYCREKAFAATLCPIAEYAVNPFPASAGSKGITH